MTKNNLLVKVPQISDSLTLEQFERRSKARSILNVSKTGVPFLDNNLKNNGLTCNGELANFEIFTPVYNAFTSWLITQMSAQNNRLVIFAAENEVINIRERQIATLEKEHGKEMAHKMKERLFANVLIAGCHENVGFKDMRGYAQKYQNDDAMVIPVIDDCYGRFCNRCNCALASNLKEAFADFKAPVMVFSKMNVPTWMTRFRDSNRPSIQTMGKYFEDNISIACKEKTTNPKKLKYFADRIHDRLKTDLCCSFSTSEKDEPLAAIRSRCVEAQFTRLRSFALV